MNQAIKLAVLISAMALFAFSQDQSQPPAGTQNPPPAATQPQPEQTAPPPSAPAQPPYHPQFKGDPAKSVAEAQTLGYMRTVIRAQKQYKTKRDKYAASLQDLAGHGSFTKRMARSTDRGEYWINFRPTKDGYELTATPKHYDETHRAFFSDEDGKIRVESDKPATANSPVLRD